MTSEPSNSHPFDIVDISAVNTESAEAIFQSACKQGFLLIKGHGFSTEQIGELFLISQQFFKLPIETKQKSKILENHGYVCQGLEVLDPSALPKEGGKGDPKEALNVSFLNLATGESEKPLPEWFDEKGRKVIEESIRKFHLLCLRVLELLAIGLNIEDLPEVKGRNWFKARHLLDRMSASTLRLLYYPSSESDLNYSIRAGAHTDYGSITLLLQQKGQEGLEILSPVSGRWEIVPYLADEHGVPHIVLNIGDLLNFWTGRLLKSTIHRVRSLLGKATDRYSIAFFCHPDDATSLDPVPSKLVREREGGANVGEPITARVHLERRIKATYLSQ